MRNASLLYVTLTLHTMLHLFVVRYEMHNIWIHVLLTCRGRGGHSRIPRHVRAPYYWRQRVISGIETVSQGGPRPKHRPPDFDICLYSHKSKVMSENVFFLRKLPLCASRTYILASSTINCAEQRSYAFSN